MCWMSDRFDTTRNYQTQVKVSGRNYHRYSGGVPFHLSSSPGGTSVGACWSQGGRIVTTFLACEAIRKERRERKQAEMRLALARRAARERSQTQQAELTTEGAV